MSKRPWRKATKTKAARALGVHLQHLCKVTNGHRTSASLLARYKAWLAKQENQETPAS